MPLVSRHIDVHHDVLTIVWDVNRPVSEVWEHLLDPYCLNEWLGMPKQVDCASGNTIKVDHGCNYVCQSIMHKVDHEAHVLNGTWQFPDEHQTQVAVAVAATTQDNGFESARLTLLHAGLAELRDDYASGWVTHLAFFEASLLGDPIPFTNFWHLHNTIVALQTGITQAASDRPPA